MSSNRSFSTPGAPVGELEYAAEERIKDAESLLDAGRFAASIASGLYALEIQLKVVICRRLDLSSLPRALQTHDLEDLLIMSGLSRKISHVKRPRHLKKNWDELTSLPEADRFRYGHDPTWDENRAQSVHTCLMGTRSGLIPWLRTQASRKSP